MTNYHFSPFVFLLLFFYLCGIVTRMSGCVTVKVIFGSFGSPSLLFLSSPPPFSPPPLSSPSPSPSMPSFGSPSAPPPPLSSSSSSSSPSMPSSGSPSTTTPTPPPQAAPQPPLSSSSPSMPSSGSPSTTTPTPQAAPQPLLSSSFSRSMLSFGSFGPPSAPPPPLSSSSSPSIPSSSIPSSGSPSTTTPTPTSQAAPQPPLSSFSPSMLSFGSFGPPSAPPPLSSSSPSMPSSGSPSTTTSAPIPQAAPQPPLSSSSSSPSMPSSGSPSTTTPTPQADPPPPPLSSSSFPSMPSFGSSVCPSAAPPPGSPSTTTPTPPPQAAPPPPLSSFSSPSMPSSGSPSTTTPTPPPQAAPPPLSSSSLSMPSFGSPSQAAHLPQWPQVFFSSTADIWCAAYCVGSIIFNIAWSLLFILKAEIIQFEKSTTQTAVLLIAVIINFFWIWVSFYIFKSKDVQRKLNYEAETSGVIISVVLVIEISLSVGSSFFLKYLGSVLDYYLMLCLFLFALYSHCMSKCMGNPNFGVTIAAGQVVISIGVTMGGTVGYLCGISFGAVIFALNSYHQWRHVVFLRELQRINSMNEQQPNAVGGENKSVGETITRLGLEITRLAEITRVIEENKKLMEGKPNCNVERTNWKFGRTS
ncbi:vegetative cell wall protein gp1-like [Euphorbia lathyris]|uniref:vegetative cell wall protein gp1-like n=1 Tax=Euphorbia lathyris TaxID=212925 RepID=UPI003313F235